MNRIVFILACSLLFLQCKTRFCPPDEKIGSLELSKETINYIPYHGSEKLRFQNNEGFEIQLSAPKGRQLHKDKLCIKSNCEGNKLGAPSTCQYFEAEAQGFTFSNKEKTIFFDLLFYSKVYNPERKTFYDICRLNLTYNSEKTEAAILTKLRFEPPYNQNAIEIENFLQPLQSLKLNGREFFAVWGQETDALKLYFNREKGLLGFKYEEEVWALMN